MKKRIHLLLALLLSTTAGNASISSLAEVPDALKKHTDEKDTLEHQEDLVKKCKKQTKILTKSLLTYLDELTQTIDYWSSQKLRPFGYFIIHEPHKWFSTKMRHKEIDETLAILRHEYERLGYYLGKISASNNFLPSYINKPEFQQKLFKQLKLIHECVTDTNLHAKADSIEDLYCIYRKNLEHLALFNEKFYENFNEFKAPGHFKKHWLAYSTGSLATALGLYYSYYNYDIVKDQASYWYDYITNFTKNRVYLPIKTAFNALFSFKKGNKVDLPEDLQILDEEGYEEEKRAFQALFHMCRDAYPELTNDEIEAEIQYILEHGTSHTTNNKFNIEASHPLIGILGKEGLIQGKELLHIFNSYFNKINGRAWYIGLSMDENPVEPNIQFLEQFDTAQTQGKLAKLSIIQLKIGLLNLSKGLHALNQVYRSLIEKKKDIDTELEAHSLTRAISLLAPMSLVLAGAGYLAKKSIDHILPHDTTNRRIQKIVHIIHQTINAARDSNKRQVHTNNGLILYWVGKLRKLAPNIDVELQKTFLQDLNSLESFDLAREQKLTAIEQMYRRYEFLLPQNR